MPSKRMVPEQELSDAGDEMGRLLAIADAEIAEHKVRAAAKDAEIAELRNALAYQDKRWRRATENMLVARRERDKATEQRDRAMKMLREPTQRMTEAALAAAGSDDDRSMTQIAYDILRAVLNAAALDAEAAAETAPSLPETP